MGSGFRKERHLHVQVFLKLWRWPNRPLSPCLWSWRRRNRSPKAGWWARVPDNDRTRFYRTFLKKSNKKCLRRAKLMSKCYSPTYQTPWHLSSFHEETNPSNFSPTCFFPVFYLFLCSSSILFSARSCLPGQRKVGSGWGLNPISARSLLRWKRAGVVMGVVNSISADLTAAGVAREFKYGEGLSVRAEIKIENVPDFCYSRSV